MNAFPWTVVGAGAGWFGSRTVSASLLFFLPVALVEAEVDPRAFLSETLPVLCEARSESIAAMAKRVPGAVTPADEEPLHGRGMEIGWQRAFALDDGDELRVELVAPGGRLQRFSVEFWESHQAELRPLIAGIADASCTVRAARRLVYEEGESFPVALEHLSPTFESTGETEPLKPAVPAGADPGGVPVAHVDSGVNYLLPAIAARLARDDQGQLLGFDFWTMDARPFDAHPVPSPFFVQRHGTRTASVLLQEAPDSRLVPYRYPRSDMSRMTDLVAHAAGHGVRIMNLSLGSNDPAEWEAFASAAAAHPDLLFVISAGNNGRDLDARPVYPAALGLENALVVTSSLPNGDLARGSNWGVESVDLLVPAERLRVTDFDGEPVGASGSSYAAARVSALAARLLAEHPGWQAPELKSAILERVLPRFAGDAGRVRHGLLPRPEVAESLPPMRTDGTPRELSRDTIDAEDLYDDPGKPAAGYLLEPSLAYFEAAAWEPNTLHEHLRQAAAILSQCGIHIPRARIHALEGPAAYHYFHDATGTELVRHIPLSRPAAFFVTDTLQMEPYDAEAIGRGNSGTRPALQDTVWMTEAIRDPGIALAHEFVHVLMDSGEHVDKKNNLMRDETAPGNTELTRRQCDAITSTGVSNGLLTATGG